MSLRDFGDLFVISSSSWWIINHILKDNNFNSKSIRPASRKRTKFWFGLLSGFADIGIFIHLFGRQWEEWKSNMKSSWHGSSHTKTFTIAALHTWDSPNMPIKFKSISRTETSGSFTESFETQLTGPCGKHVIHRWYKEASKINLERARVIKFALENQNKEAKRKTKRWHFGKISLTRMRYMWKIERSTPLRLEHPIFTSLCFTLLHLHNSHLMHPYRVFFTA